MTIIIITYILRQIKNNNNNNDIKLKGINARNIFGIFGAARGLVGGCVSSNSARKYFEVEKLSRKRRRY